MSLSIDNNKNQNGPVIDNQYPENPQDQTKEQQEESRGRLDPEKLKHLDDKQLMAELVSMPVVYDGNLCMSEIFQKVQEAEQGMARADKEMVTGIIAMAIKARDKVLNDKLTAAKKEKDMSWHKAVTSAGITMGAQGASIGLTKLKQVRTEKNYIENEIETLGLNKKNMTPKSLEGVRADAKNYSKAAGNSKAGEIIGSIGPSGNSIAEGIFSGQQQEITTTRAEADALQTNLDILNKQADRCEAEYQECRRRALEGAQAMVALHAQMQQAGSFKT